MIRYEEIEEKVVVWCTATIEREGASDHIVSQGALKGEFFKDDLTRARRLVFDTVKFYLEANGCEGKPMKGTFNADQV